MCTICYSYRKPGEAYIAHTDKQRTLLLPKADTCLNMLAWLSPAHHDFELATQVLCVLWQILGLLLYVMSDPELLERGL